MDQQFNPDKQHTLSQSLSISGTGLHTGVLVDMTLHPANPGFGIQFQRVDLPARIGLERVQGDWRVVLQFKKQKAQIAGFGIRRLDGHSFRASHLLVQGIDYHVVEKGRKSVDRHEVHGMEVALGRNRHAIGALAFG